VLRISRILYQHGSRSSVSGIATRLRGGRSGVRITADATGFSPRKRVQTPSGSHTASYSKCTEFLSPSEKRLGREVSHSPPPIVEVKNEGSHTAPISLRLHGVDRENFTSLSFVRNHYDLAYFLNVLPQTMVYTSGF
jgi:hypothetical protein